MAETKKLWLTRPKEDSEHFAAELAYHHIDTLIAPVMHVVHRPLEALPDVPNAILLTSRHATHVLADLPSAWRSLPTYCVGGATASYARDFGFTRVIPGTSDIMHLLPRMVSELTPAQEIVYFTSDETRVDVPSLLSVHGIRTRVIEVYRAVAEKTLSPAIITALKANEISGVTFFSPRSAAITIDLMNQSGLGEHASALTAYCLSLNVANAARTLPWARLMVSPSPSRRAMRELILSHRPKSG